MKPILLEVAGWSLGSYSLALAGGACVLILVNTFRARRDGLPPHHIALASLLALYAGLAGARLLFVFQNSAQYPDLIEALMSPHLGGFVSYGGLLGGLLAVALYCRGFKLPLRQVFDSGALGLCLFAAVGRLGCFAAGCCYGRPTESLWGVVFPAGSEPASHWEAGIAVHPTQLYAAGYLLCLAAVLWRLEKPRVPGRNFLILILGHSGARFVNEFLRGDSTPYEWGLKTSQWLSVALAGTSLLLLA